MAAPVLFPPQVDTPARPPCRSQPKRVFRFPFIFTKKEEQPSDKTPKQQTPKSLRVGLLLPLLCILIVLLSEPMTDRRECVPGHGSGSRFFIHKLGFSVSETVSDAVQRPVRGGIGVMN